MPTVTFNIALVFRCTKIHEDPNLNLLPPTSLSSLSRPHSPEPVCVCVIFVRPAASIASCCLQPQPNFHMKSVRYSSIFHVGHQQASPGLLSHLELKCEECIELQQSGVEMFEVIPGKITGTESQTLSHLS